MEGRTVFLAKLPTENLDVNLFISPSLRHLLLWNNNYLTVYHISKCPDFDKKEANVIWTHTKDNIESAILSEDGKQFGLLLDIQPKKIYLYRIKDKDVFEEKEGIIEEKSSRREDVCDSFEKLSDHESLIQLKDDQVITYGSECLSCYLVTPTGTLQIYCVSLPQDTISYHHNKTYFYCLSDFGTVYVYSLNQGHLIGVCEVYNILPKGIQCCRLRVSSRGSQVALLSTSNHIYILDISTALTSTSLPSLQHASAASSSASVSSFKTSVTSRSSNYSRVDSLREEKSKNKKLTSIATASSATAYWFSYLEILKNKKNISTGGDVEPCIQFICLRDIPNNYMIQSIHFCQDSLGVWASHPDRAAESFYRLYDTLTGQLESMDILSPDTKIVHLESPCISLDLFVQGSSLFLPLGVVSRDTLIQKMIGGENEIEVDNMIGHTVLPLPFLQEGLRIKQLEMVRQAFNLHTQGFKSKLNENEGIEDLVASTQQLFNSIETSRESVDGDNSWNLQVERLALTHANTLLSLLTRPAVQADLQTEILQFIIRLREGERRSCVELPIIPQWTSWVDLSDYEVLLHSDTAFNLIRSFLTLHRGWTEEELRGERFYHEVLKVTVSLLQRKKLTEAFDLLAKLNFDPEKEMNKLFLTCKEPLIRDYLFASERLRPTDEVKKAWQFLTLIESVLIDQKWNVLQRLLHCPLNVSQVLKLSATDRARIAVDLYLTTAEPKLESHLEKQPSLQYLVNHNYKEVLIACIINNGSYSNLSWPTKVFSQWKIDEEFVDGLMFADCATVTNHQICNKLAERGVFISPDKSRPAALLLRMASAKVFPDLKQTLDQVSANISYPQFLNLILSNAIENNLVELAIKVNLNGSQHSSPDWKRLLDIHSMANKTWTQSAVTHAVEETTGYLASLESMESSVYLQQHPIVAVVTSLLKEQDVWQFYSHVSPLLNAMNPPSSSRQGDISLYTVLAKTLPFHTENIFQQRQGTNKSEAIADFSDANLSLQYGVSSFLACEDFVRQGRPSAAFSFLMSKGKFPIRKKRLVSEAHGLALCNIHNLVIACSCIAFVELMGQDSSLLRTQIAVATTLQCHIDKQTLSEMMMKIVKERDGATSSLLNELEKCFKRKWKPCRMAETLSDLHLAVRYCVCHNLPPPQATPIMCLEEGNWLMFMLVAQMYQYPLSKVQDMLRNNLNSDMSAHLYYAIADKQKENVKPFVSETNLLGCVANAGNNADRLLSHSVKLNSSTLALLGASVPKPPPVEVGLGTWLLTSLCPEHVEHCPHPPWTHDTFTQLLEKIVKYGYFYTISEGFLTFQPVNPICILASFFIDSVVDCKFQQSAVNLKRFMALLRSLPDEGNEDTFLLSKKWIAVTSFRMACNALAYSYQSCYLRRCFLKTLCDAQFTCLISEGKRMLVWLKLSLSLADTPLHLDWEKLCVHLDLANLSQLLKNLEDQKMFKIAYEFARLAHLPIDHVLVAEWNFLALSDDRKEHNFWKRCDDSFTKGNIGPKVAVSFYKKQANSTDNVRERYILLKLALKWIKEVRASTEDVPTLQLQVYSTCLQDSFSFEVVTEGCTLSPLRCLSDSLILTPTQSAPQLTPRQSQRLDSVIHLLLEVGDIKTAFLLQSLFHHINQDCELLLACMRLVEGVTTLAQLPPRIQEYLSIDNLQRLRTSFLSPLPRNICQSNQNILNALYGLQAHQTSSTGLFANIISGYKISVALDCDYKTVILDRDPLNQLSPEHSLDVATCLLNLACLSQHQCTMYICSQILTALELPPVDGKYMLWNCDLGREFSRILELCGSALQLGKALMDANPPLFPTFSQPSALRKGVELLILSHNCFTRICHMEGIASVLTICCPLVNRLLSFCQWPLMVRLLTGIGRYTEMNYVLQILKANDQFEYLLGKGSDKPTQLMSATLEFVRHNKELFSLVAHHFSMYSELASLYEEEAQSELARLERKEPALLTVTEYNRRCLHSAMSKFSDATEHYIQAKKMKCGVSTIQQAELVAVQLSYMSNGSCSTVPCLINLTSSEVLEVIHTVLTCEEAHVVVKAYSISGDWAAALYNKCVVHGDSSYLTTWTKYHQLTKTIVQDVAHRFQCEKETNAASVMNMKRFVSLVSLLDVKYHIASQLGFKDILQHLLNSPDMAYLKDTVWQSGYKNQTI